jgi:addiction module HigA family antidote
MPKLKLLAPVHPGEILLEDYMKPLGLTANALAMNLRVPANRISAIVAGKRAITADTALRLGRYFGTSPEMWIGIQGQYDLQTTQDEIGEEIERSVLVGAR